MAQNSTAAAIAYVHDKTALAFVIHYLNSVLPEKTSSLVDEMRSNPANLLNWYKFIGSRLNCVKSHMDIHNDLVSSFTERGTRRRIWGDDDTDDECISPDTIPIDHHNHFQVARKSPVAIAVVAIPANSNIICAADDDDDANSIMTAATSNANPDVITASTAADNLGFDHPDVVEQLMKFDFEFADSNSQSNCLAQHQCQSHTEIEPQIQYLGHSDAQLQHFDTPMQQQQQQQQQQHYNHSQSPSFEFQVY